MSEEVRSRIDPSGVPEAEAPAASRRLRIEPPPRDVLERAKRREPAALEAFFDVYFAHVHAFAAWLLGGGPQAEDVAQDVFFKIHRGIDRIDPGRDPWPWIAVIVHNACRDRWRARSRRGENRTQSIDADAYLADQLPSPDADPETLALATERKRLVRAALERLAPEDRQLLLMYNYEGLSHLDVAEILGIRHAAARKRYSRALEALGRILRETMER